MKKIGTLALSLALSASLAAGAFAADGLLIAPNPEDGTPTPEVVFPNPGEGYHATLVLNGTELDTSAIPASPDYKMLPLRLVAESDHGSASWFEEENQGFFYLDGVRILVNFADNTIDVDGTIAEGTAAVVDGVTFIPAEVLGGIEGYTVNLNPELDVDRIDVTTPNGAPMTKLAYDIIDTIQMACGMKNSPQDLKDYFEIDTDNYEEIVAFSSMNIRADTLFIAKVAEDGCMDKAQAAFEARRAGVQQSFENYLQGPLEMAKDGKVVIDGDYIMLVISEDNDKAIELFHAFVAGQTAE